MYRPTKMLNKVQSGGIAGVVAGSVTTILLWLLETYGGVQMPDYVASAVGVLITLLVTIATAYLAPLLPGEIEQVPGMYDRDRRNRSTPLGRSNRMKLALVALLALLVGSTVQAYIPNVTTGDPAPFPERVTLTADRYAFVGSAAAYVACAPDGTLRLSAYAKRPDGTEGHTVFRVDLATNQAIELPRYRPEPVIRGSLEGRDLRACGVDGVLSVVLREKPATFYLYQGQ